MKTIEWKKTKTKNPNILPGQAGHIDHLFQQKLYSHWSKRQNKIILVLVSKLNNEQVGTMKKRGKNIIRLRKK